MIGRMKSMARQLLPAPFVHGAEALLGVGRWARALEPTTSVVLLGLYIWNVRIRGKVLVVIERAGNIGDLVCILACVRGLRALHPNGWLVLITPRGCAQLAISSGLCDGVSTTETLFHRLLKVVGPQLNYKPLREGRTSLDEGSHLHLAEQWARAIGTHADLYSVTLSAPQRVRSHVAQLLRAINVGERPIVVVHSGPTWPVREWPLERWAELVKKISADGSIVIRVGTDFDCYSNYIPQTPVPNVINWVNKLDVMGLVALLEQTNVFMGIDSGPLHIATALGVPSVVLFGPTDGRLRVHPRAQSIIVTAKVSCLGCHHAPTGPLHWETGCPNNIACMREISPDEVFDSYLKVKFFRTEPAKSAGEVPNLHEIRRGASYA
jgi:ADP-heptose:LPS heptosyltransferase